MHIFYPFFQCANTPNSLHFRCLIKIPRTNGTQPSSNGSAGAAKRKRKKAKQKRWVTSLSLGEGPGNPCALCRAHTSAGLDISRWLGEKEGVIARPARTLPRGRARARAHLSLCACAPAAQQQQRNGRRVGESGRSLSDRAAAAGGTNTHTGFAARAPRGARWWWCCPIIDDAANWFGWVPPTGRNDRVRVRDRFSVWVCWVRTVRERARE